jgi:hypothetical protein
VCWAGFVPTPVEPNTHLGQAGEVTLLWAGFPRCGVWASIPVKTLAAKRSLRPHLGTWNPLDFPGPAPLVDFGPGLNLSVVWESKITGPSDPVRVFSPGRPPHTSRVRTTPPCLSPLRVTTRRSSLRRDVVLRLSHPLAVAAPPRRRARRRCSSQVTSATVLDPRHPGAAPSISLLQARRPIALPPSRRRRRASVQAPPTRRPTFVQAPLHLSYSPFLFPMVSTPLADSICFRSWWFQRCQTQDPSMFFSSQDYLVLGMSLRASSMLVLLISTCYYYLSPVNNLLRIII